LIRRQWLSCELKVNEQNIWEEFESLTCANWSKRPNSSFNSLTSSCALHWDDSTVKPTISANKILFWEKEEEKVKNEWKFSKIFESKDKVREDACFSIGVSFYSNMDLYTVESPFTRQIRINQCRVKITRFICNFCNLLHNLKKSYKMTIFLKKPCKKVILNSIQW